MEGITNFFDNPTWIGLLAIIAIQISTLVQKIIDRRNMKKDKESQQKQLDDVHKRQEVSYKTTDRMADAVELLINNNTNKVNLMQTENIISRTLLASKAILEREVRRIFEHNHREISNRQEIIKQSLVNVTMNVYENDIKMLSQLYYKHKSLSEFLLNIDTDKFFKELIKLVFTTGGIADNELRDIIAFIDSEFDMFILQGKKYYNNL